jgi:hypothetical protein
MKLSDVKGSRTFEVIADIVVPIANISEDDTVMELFDRREIPEGMDKRTFIAERIKTSVPCLVRDHKSDVLAILAAIEGVDTDEYENGLTLAKLVGDLYELVTDDEFLAFLS